MHGSREKVSFIRSGPDRNSGYTALALFLHQSGIRGPFIGRDFHHCLVELAVRCAGFDPPHDAARVRRALDLAGVRSMGDER
ncbi:hypothetical protein TVNIR_2042 [Thioalkalivibrio nitratireducens DSM 14787]|uniref:Uncharacterized protein n=1 Tax=Thioalkalivibrio nitratireducens (strain DSM 14787 / UNIQEM 213 / ALEN2) TaxID=1255043 RepID=L0DXG9_THIND|nr:hypothetical protein TVNIR_2042 [Thioalkalivibrio nitratireducens DSM 14787]